jgi:mitotic-spindle organizing protein 1|tara:strand:+ start:2028 stop:2348 length:321 start_codon:yes stop_codon:yes gene_type:complete
MVPSTHAPILRLPCAQLSVASPAVLFDISQLLETGLDRETLDILVQLVETGVNPEALASVVKELRREAAALASQSDQVLRCSTAASPLHSYRCLRPLLPSFPLAHC